MKNSASYLLLILTLCSFLQTSAQKRTLDLPNFNELNFGISGTLYLRQGSKQKVEVECSDSVFDQIEFNIKGDKLVIESEGNWGWGNIKTSDLTIYITMTEIEELGLSGSGKLIGEEKINAEELNLRLSGSGNMSIEVSTDELTAQLSGSGKLVISGTSNSMKARVSGSGSIKAEDLIVNALNAAISGSGSVSITANEEIEARISGSGSVYYKGDPKKRDVQSSGSGKIRKLD